MLEARKVESGREVSREGYNETVPTSQGSDERCKLRSGVRGECSRIFLHFYIQATSSDTFTALWEAIARYATAHVCLSVCGILVLWLLALTRVENNYTTNYSGDITRFNHKPDYLKSRGSSSIFGWNRGGVWKRLLCGQKVANISETVRYRTEVTTKCGYKLVHSLSIGYIFDDVTWPVSELKEISSRRFQLMSEIRFTYLLFLQSFYWEVMWVISANNIV